MRLFLVTGEFPPMHGGVGDYTYEIARGLAARGVEVHVFTSPPAAGGPAPLHFPFPVSASIPRWDWSGVGMLQQAIRAGGPDIVQIEYQTGAFGMHPAINLLPRWTRRTRPTTPAGRPVRIVTTFHDLLIPYLFPKAGPLRDWVTRELARSSDAAIATTEQDCARLSRWGVKSPTLIPIGSNIPATPPAGYRREAWRAQLGISDDETLLCHFGFVSRDKGVDTLLWALHQLMQDARWRSLRPRLLMIGGRSGTSNPSQSSSLKQVVELIPQLGLEDRVLWTEYVPPEIVTANFIASDVCVLPFSEGATFHHGTLMAALAHAMPIVTTRLPSASQIASSPDSSAPRLRDGENCLLVPPRDPTALADAIGRVAIQPELRATLRRGAADLARTFSWDHIVQQHLDLYERVLEASHQGTL